MPVAEIGIRLHSHGKERLTGVSMHAQRINECSALIDRYPNFFGKYRRIREQFSDHVEKLKSEVAAASIDKPIDA